MEHKEARHKQQVIIIIATISSLFRTNKVFFRPFTNQSDYYCYLSVSKTIVQLRKWSSLRASPLYWYCGVLGRVCLLYVHRYHRRFRHFQRQNSIKSSLADIRVKMGTFFDISGTTLQKRTESVPETLENFCTLTRLSAREDFMEIATYQYLFLSQEFRAEVNFDFHFKADDECLGPCLYICGSIIIISLSL